MSDEPEERDAVPVSWKAIGLWLLPALLVVPPADLLVAAGFAVEAYEADGPSMQPTLLNGDRFLVDRGAYALRVPGMDRSLVTWGAPSAGDVLVIESPADGIDIVKRVIAVGGDDVEIRNDEVFVNGQSLTRRPYQREGHERTMVEGAGEREWSVTASDLSPPSNFGPRTVEPGTVFVLGDHRDRSNDSRNIGMIPLENVVGRAVGLYWSSGGEGTRFDRIGLVFP